MEPMSNSYQITISLIGVKKLVALEVAEAIDIALTELVAHGAFRGASVTTAHIKDVR